MVLVSHDPMAADYADRVLALRDGRLGEHDPHRRLQRVKSAERPAALPRAPARAAAGRSASRSSASPRASRCCSPRRSPVTSLQSSVAELSRGIVGHATLQLLARDPHGFPQSMLARVRAIPGVRVAAPLLEAERRRSGPRGSESVRAGRRGPEPVGARRHARAGTWRCEPFGGVGAVVLPSPLARTIGVDQVRSGSHAPLAGHTAGRRCTPSCRRKADRAAGSTARSRSRRSFYAQELAGCTVA